MNYMLYRCIMVLKSSLKFNFTNFHLLNAMYVLTCVDKFYYDIPSRTKSLAKNNLAANG